MQGTLETWVQSLNGKDPLGGGNGNLLQYFVWKIPWREEPGRLQSVGLQSRTRLSAASYVGRKITSFT